MSLPETLTDVLTAASGRADRREPVLPTTGGPAGNAQLTAWIGLLLLVLFLAELITLLDLRGLITWHITVGLLLIPPALAKTATTGWRIVRHYSGASAYTHAPPLLLRLLGPLVVLGTLAVLGTGTALALLGPDSGNRSLPTILDQHITLVTLHKGAFLAWAVTTGLHVLARALPALHLAGTRTEVGGPPPGRYLRIGALLGTAGISVIVAVAFLAMTPTTG